LAAMIFPSYRAT